MNFSFISQALTVLILPHSIYLQLYFGKRRRQNTLLANVKWQEHTFLNNPILEEMVHLGFLQNNHKKVIIYVLTC